MTETASSLQVRTPAPGVSVISRDRGRGDEEPPILRLRRGRV